MTCEICGLMHYRCQSCNAIVEDLNEVIDEDTLEHVWVCEDCVHDYPFSDDEGPDCMID